MYPKDVEDRHDRSSDQLSSGDEKYDKYDEKMDTKHVNEKEVPVDISVLPAEGDKADNVRGLETGYEDLAEAESKLASMPLDRCVKIVRRVYELHKRDQNFPSDTLENMRELLENPDVLANPSHHAELIHSMKIEAILIHDSSPYAMVRSAVEPTDDPTMPTLTFRVWVIGIVFCGFCAFVNQLFDQRWPTISISKVVCQIVAYPCGTGLAKILPKKVFSLFGRRFTLNPGPFNRKEHMLITIMANCAIATPYMGNIILVQAMPQYFDQSFAKQFGYQIVGALGSNLAGYGLAGLCRSFLVYPSHCIWPTSLPTLAVNKAFHTEENTSVPGPFKRLYSWTRLNFFLVVTGLMFCWWWVPNLLFPALQTFNWMSWIAPFDKNLNWIVGTNNGLGLNPIPTFDWNMQDGTPFSTPLFSTLNRTTGAVINFIFICGLYFTNTWNSSFLPILSNRVFDNTGKAYQVKKMIDDHAHFDEQKYQTYSEPWMAASNLASYFWFFAQYASLISYTFLYHRHEIAVGFRMAWKGMRNSIPRFARKNTPEEDEQEALGEDVHFRLMRAYKEVPDWWYLILLCFSLGLGMAGVWAWPTYATPAVVIFGIIMALIFMIPIGLVKGITGLEVTMNVLAQAIGGVITPGNPLAVNFFKMYGYITTHNAVFFSEDLKMAHYAKLPPRDTFTVQVVGTIVATFVATSILNWVTTFHKVCQPDASFKMICAGLNTFFTASVFWGVIGPTRLFGAGGRYTLLLLGFPIGFAIPIIFYFIQKKFPRNRFLRSVHPVAIMTGGIAWGPTNMAYFLPTLYFALLSWGYVKRKYFDLWSKYNFVLEGALTAGVAICGIIIFLCIQLTEKDQNISWWGTEPLKEGCDAPGQACTRFPIPDKGYFGSDPGNFH